MMAVALLAAGSYADVSVVAQGHGGGWLPAAAEANATGVASFTAQAGDRVVLVAEGQGNGAGTVENYALASGSFTNQTSLSHTYQIDPEDYPTTDLDGTQNLALTGIVVVNVPVIHDALNVLFIAIDDINPIMGCYGNTLIQTPEMDALASRGTLFENAHCQFSMCGPSRASLMTGLMPEDVGVMGVTKMRGISSDGSNDNAKGLTNLVTIPEHFISHGYETAAIGKINDGRCVGSINPDGTINQDGWTVDDPPAWSHSFSGGGGSVSSSSAVRDGKTVKRAAESVNKPAANFADGGVATQAIHVMNTLAAGNKPFFLGVGFKRPHLPFLAPKSSWDLYQRDDFTTHPFQTPMLNATPYSFNTIREMRGSYYLETDGSGEALPITSGILPDDQQKLLLHGYYACISHVDEQVGRVLDQLDALGLSSNTIIVLWGDHGFHLGNHNEWGKHTSLEQATRMPLIISAPGYLQDQKTMAPVSLIDLYPTLCELAGLPIPEQPLSLTQSTGRPLAGKSLVPILADPAARIQTGTLNVNPYAGGTYGYAYRTERYRFTEFVNSSGGVSARELFDYETDPMETVNLAVYPEYEALMYQFSKATRSSDAGATSKRMNISLAMATPSDKSLVGLGMSGAEVSWPDAEGITYNLLSKTNLLDASWSTNQTPLSESPATVMQNKPSKFFRVEVVSSTSGGGGGPANLLINPGFESGTAGWTKHGGLSIATVGSPVYAGSSAGRAYSRTATYSGLAQDVTAQLVSGTSYDFSCRARISSGSSSVGMTIKTTYTDASKTYHGMASATANSSGWTEVSGTYTFSPDPARTVSSVLMYIAGAPV